MPGISKPQPYRQTANCHESGSSFSFNASDEGDADDTGPREQTQQPISLQWTSPSCPQSSVAHIYTEALREKKDNEAPYINDSSSPFSVFLLYFA